MSFLEAHRIVANFTGGPPLPFLLAVSGTPDKLDLFLKAAGAKRKRTVIARTLPFNTLGQFILGDAPTDEPEVFVLFPWDFVPEADWRSGLPQVALDIASLEARAEQIGDRLGRRGNARLVYVPAPIPPLFANPAATARLAAWLTTLAVGLRANLLPASVFSLASYLSNGSPFSSRELGTVAEVVIERALYVADDPRKVLVTDLDNVIWGGVIGEDGLDGIQFAPEGVGYRHFLYQTFLRKLKREGTLLAAVSRNDAEIARAPFLTGRMSLRADDFVAIVASYNAKSSQIKEIARQLNLGLESFVFVDDNPIEIEEVSAAVSQIRTAQFPHGDDELPAFFAQLASLFPRTEVTAEDVERTAMYRRRLEGMIPAVTEGADLTGFLRGLEMSLAIHDRSRGDRTRAIQLINKTNQFNVNGVRVNDEEVGAILAAGGRLYTCNLGDRTGSHGEILACLIDGDGIVQSLVMSCRVFQRRVEHAFFAWLGDQPDPPHALRFAATPRNEPAQQFLRSEVFRHTGNGLVAVDLAEFARRHADALDLFALSVPGEPAADRNG